MPLGGTGTAIVDVPFVQSVSQWGGIMKKFVVGAIVCAALIAGGAAPAFAGERGGNGEATPALDHAKSLCVFSGLEDFDFESDVEPGVVQNWGHIPKEARDMYSVRGAAVVALPWGEEGCNAHMFPNGSHD